MVSNSTLGCILHTSSGQTEAERLLLKFKQTGSSDIIDLWSFIVPKSGLSTLQNIEMEIGNYDFIISVLTVADFQDKGTTKSEIVTELIKLGMGIGSIGAQRVFLVIPEGYKLSLPSIFEGHQPYVYKEDTNEQDWGTLAIEIANQVRGFEKRRKSDVVFDRAVIEMLSAAIMSEPLNFQSVLSTLKEHLRPPKNFDKKTAYLFEKKRSKFIQIGSSDSFRKDLQFKLNDETSYVAATHIKKDAMLVSLKEQDLDGSWKYLFCIPISITQFSYVLTIHLRSNVYLKENNLSKPMADLMVNIRLFKALERILEGRKQSEKKIRTSKAEK